MSTALGLTPLQLEVVGRLKAKFASGEYPLEKTNCPCGRQDDETLSEQDRYGLPLETAICRGCGMVRLKSRLAGDALSAFYQGEYRDLYMGPEYGSLGNYFTGMVRRGYYVWELLRRHAPTVHLKKASVLEVGCSSGGILVPFLESGASVIGYDHDQRYLDYGKERCPGLDLRPGGLETVAEHEARYDVVIVNHVFEHLSDPLAAARILRKIVKPHGVVYVSVPGVTNPEYFFSPDKSFLGGLHVAHLYNFSRATLVQTMRGFRPVYADEAVRAIFTPSDGAHAVVPDAREYGRVKSFLAWYEHSAAGRTYRRYFKIKERYQNGILWRMYKLKTFLTSGVILPY